MNLAVPVTTRVPVRPLLLPARQRLLVLPRPALDWRLLLPAPVPPIAVSPPVPFPGRYIEPGLFFFTGGNPIGGPSQAFRGVAASRFPTLAAVLGPGGPLAPSGLGIAGAPIGF